MSDFDTVIDISISYQEDDENEGYYEAYVTWDDLPITPITGVSIQDCLRLIADEIETLHG